jgi:hypothetical protein
MANRQGYVDLREAQVSTPVRTLVWFGLAWMVFKRLNSAPDGVWWGTPTSGHFTPGKRHGTHFIGGLAGPRAVMQGCGNSPIQRDSISDRLCHYILDKKHNASFERFNLRIVSESEEGNKLTTHVCNPIGERKDSELSVRNGDTCELLNQCL